MPCACQYGRPQLNETVTGRQSGCATCLCGSGDAGSSRNSAQNTQPSSGMDDLQQRVAIQLDIDGPVQCCHCCGQYPQHLAERAVRSPKQKSKHGSTSNRARHCGPWEQRSNGGFVLRGQDWEPSTDGRYSVRFSLELRYNSTRAASVATQPPTAGWMSPKTCPVMNTVTESQSPGAIHNQVGEWIDPVFNHRHYLCACPSRVGSPRSSATFNDLMTGTRMHSAYPETIDVDDYDE